MEDWQKKGYDPPHGEPDEGEWQIHIALNPAERDAIRDAAPLVMPAEKIEVHTDITDGHDGDSLIALRVFAKTREEATDEAKYRYSQIRDKAGLPYASALVLGYIAPWWHRNRLRHLSREAHELHRQRRHELAVIRIQTANELSIAETMRKLLGGQHPEADLGALMRLPSNLRDDRAKAFLQMLCGRRIQDEPWWPEYVEHVTRRNAIIHEGIAISYEDAVASLEVSLKLGDWLLDIRGTPAGDDEESDGDAER
jgi:hypothetical protein